MTRDIMFSSSGSHILYGKSKQALGHNGHCVEFTFFEGMTIYLDPYDKKLSSLHLLMVNSTQLLTFTISRFI